MKKLLLGIAALAVVACGPKNTDTAAGDVTTDDTTGIEARTDTTGYEPGAQGDTGAMGGQRDTAMYGGQRDTGMYGGQQDTAMMGGQRDTAGYMGGQQDTAMMGGQQDTSMMGGQQDTSGFMGGQQQRDTSMMGGQQDTSGYMGVQPDTTAIGGQQDTSGIMGGQQDTSGYMGGQQQQQDTSAAAGMGAMGGAAGEVTAQLQPKGESSASGTVTLRSAGASQTEVRLELQHEPLGTTGHAAHIHTGTCENPGPPVAPLETAKGEQQGHAKSTSTVSIAMSTLTDGNHIVQVHRTASQQSPAIACAPISASGAGSMQNMDQGQGSQSDTSGTSVGQPQ